MAKNVYDVLETVATKGFPPIWFPHILPEEAVLKMQEVAIKTLNKESDQIVKLADATVKAKVAEEENKLDVLTDEKEQRESKENNEPNNEIKDEPKDEIKDEIKDEPKDEIKDEPKDEIKDEPKDEKEENNESKDDPNENNELTGGSIRFTEEECSF
jgi:hypothetical protein